MDNHQKLFLELKSVCVPLLASARLDPRTVQKTHSLLADLASILRRAKDEELDLKPFLISYAFFPLSSLLSRNASQLIPDRVLETVFESLTILFHWWWWTCEDQVWTQFVMLAGTVLGVGAKEKGKGKERADETKEAAVRLLLSLLEDRIQSPGPGHDEGAAKNRLSDLQTHAQNERTAPILGQTLNALLEICDSTEHLPLQSAALEAVEILVRVYVPLAIVPTILPGVVSTMIRVALGQPRDTTKKLGGGGWVNGNIVAVSLRVMDCVIIRAVGDDVCLKAGLVKDVTTLEDLTELVSDNFSSTSDVSALDNRNNTTLGSRVYETPLTKSYLHATTSQLLIALNTSIPTLLPHPNPSALISLSFLSSSLLHKARLTLPNIRPLLVSALLTLTNNSFPSVSQSASENLRNLLSTTCQARYDILQAIMQIASEALGSLPRLIAAQSDAQLKHITGQVVAICSLGSTQNENTLAIKTGISKLLGPTGRIEKWGWRLLSALHFRLPKTAIAAHGVFLLESTVQSDLDEITFPEALMENIDSADVRESLEKMLRALGRTAKEECLFSVEWLVEVGSHAEREEAPAALWCACRLLEGIVNEDLGGRQQVRNAGLGRRGRVLETFARWLGKLVSDSWDAGVGETVQSASSDSQSNTEPDSIEQQMNVEFVKGLTPLETRFDVLSSKSDKGATSGKRRRDAGEQLILHKAFSLQLLSLTSTILESRVSVLLLHALYPVLHSLVSPSAFLSSTAFATLQHIANSAGYASPANLLLSNFDYALDGAARRLTKRLLDPDATKVLAVLIRLVGKDVVERAGDVVEECFDRLDEYHGYTVVVEGLIEVLLEVVRVVEAEMEDHATPLKRSRYEASPPDGSSEIPDEKRVDSLLEWMEHRRDPPSPSDDDDRGPSPREPFGKGKGKDVTPEEEGEEEKRLLNEADNALAEPPASPTQALVSQIISRSLYFLTHGDPPIRSRVLALLSRSVPVLATHESSILPVVHKAWPFVINRLGDTETYVVSAAAGLIEALVTRHGPFMASRVWDDVWPRFRTMLAKLDAADAQSALSRRSTAFSVGTESVYTHTHRLYRAMLRTMTAAITGGVQTQERRTWDVMLAFRRFLHSGMHPELQDAACALYTAFGTKNPDAVWLVLVSTAGLNDVAVLGHLKQEKWDVKANVERVLARL